MKGFNDSMPWATILIGILVLVAAAVGGAVVIWGKPGALSFQEYLDLLKNFAIAVGILGVGRGIASYGKQSSQASQLGDSTLSTIAPPSEGWRAPDAQAYAPAPQAPVAAQNAAVPIEG